MKIRRVNNTGGEIYRIDNGPARFGNPSNPSWVAGSLAWHPKCPDELILEAATNHWGAEMAAKFLSLVHEKRGELLGVFAR